MTLWPFYLIEPWGAALLAIAAIVLGVGRLVRIITYDDFPPSVWWRIQWSKLNARPDGSAGPWTKLFTCYWCLTPWVMAIAILWYWWGTLWLPAAIAWWIFWGWLGLSYLTSMVVNRDEKE